MPSLFSRIGNDETISSCQRSLQFIINETRRLATDYIPDDELETFVLFLRLEADRIEKRLEARNG